MEAFGNPVKEISWPRDNVRFDEHFPGNLVDLYYPPHQDFHLGGRYVGPTGGPPKAGRNLRVLPCSFHPIIREKRRLNLSVLYVCRRLYSETTRAFYASNEYVFTEFTVFDCFMRNRTPLQIESITNLTLSMVFTTLSKGIPSCYATHNRWNHSLRSEVVTKLQGLRALNAKVCLAFITSHDFQNMKQDLVKDFNLWFEGLLNFEALPLLKSVDVVLADGGATQALQELLHNAEFSRTEALAYSDRIAAYISKKEMEESTRIPILRFIETTTAYLKEDVSQAATCSEETSDEEDEVF